MASLPRLPEPQFCLTDSANKNKVRTDMTTALKTATANINDIPTDVELVQRARVMMLILLEKAESLETIPMASTYSNMAIVEASFFSSLQPARDGADALTPAVFYWVLMELVLGCGRSA